VKLRIKATVLYDGKGGKSDSVFIDVEDRKIAGISKRGRKFDVEGFVTPAFIDAHAHIGMARMGEPYTEDEANEVLDEILPTLNPIDSIYFDDLAFRESIEHGVLYSCVVPGSGNVFGGRAMVIRNFSSNRKDCLVKDYGFKMALGYNPRSTKGWKGTRPETRMGVYSLIERKFNEVLRKKEKFEIEERKYEKELKKKVEKKELTKKEMKEELELFRKKQSLEYSDEERLLLQLLSGEKTAKVHVHKEDDVLYLVSLVEKYGVKVTADHTCDIFREEPFVELKKKKIPVVYGPISSFAYKVELKHASYHNVKPLLNSGVFFGVMTDHPVVLQYNLFHELKHFLRYGMSREEAISLITGRNAEILGVSDVLGSVEEGKWASLVVWNRDPFELDSFPVLVLGEGEVAVIDPGPNDQAHVQTLLDSVANEQVTHIIVTHCHRDHSGG